AELERLRSLPDEAVAPVLTRLDRVESALRSEVQQATNTLAACVAELDDRLARGGQVPPSA
ncbi:MAG TPA: LapA family protein, partial [Methylomirabilota bacterium]|nr:LapA family protein [Methylomirabilota bacterium]